MPSAVRHDPRLEGSGMSGGLLNVAIGATIVIVIIAGAIGLASAAFDVLGVEQHLDSMLGHRPEIQWDDGVR